MDNATLSRRRNTNVAAKFDPLPMNLTDSAEAYFEESKLNYPFQASTK